jgi:hypothetical protein
MADNRRYRRIPKTPYSKALLNTKFLNNPPQPGQQTFDLEQPTITTNESDFLQCCEQLLALRSFYNYSGVHCPEAIPLKEDGTLDVESVEEHTRVAAQLLKLSVNRGKGTMHWNIPKFIDLLLLPHYMGYLGSTGRFHVGFAERGLKQWAKKPADTAQKRGGGVFEGQVAARIQERAMIDHALNQMNSDEEEEEPDNDDTIPDWSADVSGSRYNIHIRRNNEGENRGKAVDCIRVDSRNRVQSVQGILLPDTILKHFKTIGRIGNVFEYRTEAIIEGTRYRTHPNYRGEGPWYDFVEVQFDLEGAIDYNVTVDDHSRYPAKLLGFYRLISDPGEVDTEFLVLAHCVQYQTLESEIYNARSHLVRPWLYEVKAGINPPPMYRTIGSVRTDVMVKQHIFGVEEIPGFHPRYPTDLDKRLLVLSDMRTEWPNVFMSNTL